MTPTLVALGQGVYSVREVCRILQPGMTPRKVHYWLGKGLLGNVVQRGGKGEPTLLSYEQLLRIRTLQHLRDALDFSLQEVVRSGLEFILKQLFAEEWHELKFFRTPRGKIGVTNGLDTYELPVGQRMLADLLPELDAFLQESRDAWLAGELAIADYSALVTNIRILAGSPVIAGTRIETAFVANLNQEVPVNELTRIFPHVKRKALEEAIRFESAAA